MGAQGSVTITGHFDISSARKSAQELQNILNKLNLNQNLSKSVNSVFGKLETEFTNFQGLLSKEMKSPKDLKGIESSYNNIINLVNNLQAQIQNIQGIDVNKLIPADFTSKLKEIINGYNELAQAKTKAEKEKTSKQNELDSEISKIEKTIKKRKDALEDLSKAEERRAQISKNLEKLTDERENYKKQQDNNKATIKSLKDEKRLRESIQKIYREKDATEKTRLKQDFFSDLKKSGLEGKLSLAETPSQAGANTQKLNQLNKIIDQKVADLLNTNKELDAKIKETQDKINIASRQKSSATGKLVTAQNKVEDTSAIDIATLERTLAELQAQKTNLTASLDPTALQKFRAELAAFAGVDISKIPIDLSKIGDYINTLQTNKVTELQGQLQGLSATANGLKTPFSGFENSLRQARNELTQMEMVSRDFDRMKYSVANFFSVFTGARMLKNTLHQASQAIKELDAAMTETAVVTNFSVSDMWDQLDLYTKTANKLGATTLGAYQTMTLFYQQGLNTEQAFTVGTETMKMARIAGMEYSEATEKMTAALRGFNMEINEISAQRVNDVYSELAKITAADTDQIATAMTKTASIADSANMSFENTAAFLTQIIETTQEAPETAGTALKTIIARFSEVKELYSKGQLTGTDEEGEVININKIDKALKSVGMSLNKFILGEQGLDEVFMELASKWDTLDLATQRYIATQAAGSRQQSRFIAMMNDYERTVELATAARDSEGSSEEQFGKTLDSMEAKTNKMKNAWQEFTLSIMDSDTLKDGVDALTTILQLINNITDALGGKGGSGILKIGAALSLGILGKKVMGGIMQFGTAQSAYMKGVIDPKTIPEGQTLLDLEKARNSAFQTGYRGTRGNFFQAHRQENQAILKGELKDYKYFNKEKLELDQKYQAKKARLQRYVEEDKTGLSAQYAQKNRSFEKAEEKYKQESQTLYQKELQQQQKDVKTEQTWGAWGIALTGAGMLLSSINSQLEETGVIGEKTSDIIGGFSTGLTTAGLAINVLKAGAVALGKTFTASLGWIGIAIGGIVAAVQVLSAVIETPEEKTERLAEEAANAQAAAEAASKAYDELLGGKSTYNDRLEALQKLTKGTTEYQMALAQANAETITFAEKYGIGLKVGQDGLLSYNESSYEQIQKDWEQESISAANRSIFSNAANKEWNSKQQILSLLKPETLELDANGDGYITREEATAAYTSHYSDGNISNREATYKDLISQFQKGEGILENPEAYAIWQSQNASEAAAIQSIMPSSELQTTGVDVLDNLLLSQVSQDIAKEKNLADLKDQLKEDLNGNNIDEEAAKVFRNTFLESDEYQKATLDQKKAMVAEQKAINTLQEETTAAYDELFKSYDKIDNKYKKTLKEYNKKTSKEINNTIAELESQGEDSQKVAEALKQQYFSQYGVAMGGLQALFNESNYGADESYNLMALLNEQLGLSSLENLNKIGSELGASVGANIAAEMTAAIGIMMSDATNGFEFEEVISGINFNNIFTALGQLEIEASRASGAVATNLAATREGLINKLGPTGLFEAFINSEGYAEAEKMVEDFIKNSGDLTASNINEIAGEIDVVNQLLDTGVMTAATLAEILGGIAEGDYTLEGLTDSLIEALNIATALSNSLARGFAYVDNYEEVRSEKDLGAFAQDRAGTIVDSLAAGRFNDSAAKQSIETLFGSEGLNNYKDFLADLSPTDSNNAKWAKFEAKMGEGSKAALQSLSEDGNFSGWWEFQAKQAKAQNKKEPGTGGILAGLKTNKDGSLDFSSILQGFIGSGEGTGTDAFIDTLTQQLGVDRGLVDAAIGDARAHAFGSEGYDAWVGLAQTDARNAVNTLFNPLNENGVPTGLTDQAATSLADVQEIFKGSGLSVDEWNAADTGFTFNQDGTLRSNNTGKAMMADNWTDANFQYQGYEGAEAKVRALDDYWSRSGKGGLTERLGETGQGKDSGKYEYQGQLLSAQEFKAQTGLDPDRSTSQKTVDYDALTQEFQEQGLGQADAQEAAAAWVEHLNDGSVLSKDIKTATGETVTLTKEAGETVEKYNQRIQDTIDAKEEEARIAEQSEIMSQSMVNAFKSLASEGISFGDLGLDQAFANIQQGINNITETPAEIEFTVNGEQQAITAANNVKTILDNIPDSKTISINFSIGKFNLPLRAGKTGALTNSIPGFAKGKQGSNPNKNSAHRYYEGMAQVAEEGPELIVTDNGAYLAGIKGPTFTYINKNDTVYTAQETKKILGNVDSKSIPGFYGGKNSYGEGMTFGSGAGSGSQKVDEEREWDPDYDRFYNLLDDIEKQLREQTKLERNLEIIKRNQEKSSNLNEARDLFKQQITNYNEQAEQQRRSYSLNAQLLKGKQWEIQKFMADNASYQKFATYNELTDTIDISWDTIMSRANWDAEYGQQVDDYISKVEELRDQLWDAEDAMMDAEDAIRDLEDGLRDYLDELKQNYLDMEQALYDALVSIKQQEITDLQEITDVQFNSNAQILTSIQEVIAEQRKLRDIAEAREDLEEKQRRLALLRRDGSGANALEIKKLEEELEDQQENFVDSLVDKSLEDLSKQNDKAQQQRQEQITLLQNLLDFNTEYGVFWPQISEMLESAFSEDGYLNQASALVEVMKKADNFKGMSELGQDKWWNDLQKTVVNAILGLDEAKREEANMASDLELEQAIALLAKEGIDAYDVLEYGATQADDFDDGYGSDLERQAAIQSQIVKANDDIKKYTEIRDGFKKEQASAKSEADKALATYEKNKSDANAKDYMNKREKYNMKSQKVDAAQSVIDKMESYKAILTAKLAKFKSGGLADFTGPAQLDGTKSKPEIVLKASDSKNFLQLKDILREMDLDNLNGKAATYFDIHIDVDEISSDYDVDKLANRVKELVVSSAQYRNNVVINRKR